DAYRALSDPCPRLIFIGRNRARTERLGLRNRVGHVVPTLEGAPDDYPRLQSEGLGIIRIDRDGLVEERERRAAAFVRQPRGLERGADRPFPCVEVLRRFAARTSVFGGKQLRADAADDARGNLVLNGEDIIEPAVVVLPPEMVAGGRIDELRGDADAITG